MIKITNWYSVHAILYFESVGRGQTEFLVWEHVYLIAASTFEEAKMFGESRAKQDESDEGITRNGVPSRLRFAKIRKVVECQDLDPQSRLPVSGTELTYEEFLYENSVEFQHYLDGGTSNVLYLGKDL